MSDSVIRLVDAIKQGDAMETEQSFADAMAEKLGAKIEDLRQATAASMFATITAEETPATEPAEAE